MELKHLANGLSTFPINDKSVFINGPKSLPKNPPDCPTLCNWVFVNSILAKELFAKAKEQNYDENCFNH